MKRFRAILFLLCCIVCCGTGFAQYPVSDTFATVGPLSSNWTNYTGGGSYCQIDVAGQVVNDDAAHDVYASCTVFWTANTFPNGSITKSVAPAVLDYTGPVVNGNASTGNGYLWDLESSEIGILVGPSVTTFSPGQTCPYVTPGDSVGLAYLASTSTIYCFDYTSGKYGSWVDPANTYTSGQPGAYAHYGGSSTHYAMYGPFQADCFPYSCNSASANPYSPLHPSTPVIDYYSATPVSVALAPTTAGWTLCYTTDGTTPTATTPGTCSHGTTYSSVFTISTTGLTTVKTIATKSGSTNSVENDYVYNVGYSVPNENGCQLFPANSIFNTPINTAPVNQTYNTAFQGTYAGSHIFHDFYAGAAGGGSGGIPYNKTTSSDPAYTITGWTVPSESDSGPYNISNSTYIEDITTPGCQVTSTLNQNTDYHLLNVANLGSSCQLQEIYQASCTAGTPNVWSGYSGAIWNLGSNALRTDTWTSADAAGLPITPFLVKYDEAVSGQITHPLRFTTQSTGDTYVWPARHAAGNGGVVPIGVRLRLKASFDITTFSPMNQVILKALQTYGMFLADNGNTGYFQGVSDPRWNEQDLDLLNAIPFSNFEVVDESGLMLNANSQQIKAVTGKMHWIGNSMTQ